MIRNQTTFSFQTKLFKQSRRHHILSRRNHFKETLSLKKKLLQFKSFTKLNSQESHKTIQYLIYLKCLVCNLPRVGSARNPGLSKLCRIARLHSVSPFVFQLLTYFGKFKFKELVSQLGRVQTDLAILSKVCFDLYVCVCVARL